MHRLTARRQNVTVMTVSALRDYLKNVSNSSCKFTIDKVDRDRVSIRADYVFSDKKKHSHVLLPAYPTGLADDAVSNNLNVVLDPVNFTNVESSAERQLFAPVLGDEALAYYERMHAGDGFPVTRCC